MSNESWIGRSGDVVNGQACALSTRLQISSGNEKFCIHLRTKTPVLIVHHGWCDRIRNGWRHRVIDIIHQHAHVRGGGVHIRPSHAIYQWGIIGIEGEDIVIEMSKRCENDRVILCNHFSADKKQQKKCSDF